jgi:hypothetical protein
MRAARPDDIASIIEFFEKVAPPLERHYLFRYWPAFHES